MFQFHKKKPLFIIIQSIIILSIVILFGLKFFAQTNRGVVPTGDLFDRGWKYALARLPQMNMYLGKDTFFTYGPLANKFPPIIIPGHLQQQTSTQIQYMIIIALFYIFYFGLIVKLYRKHPLYAIIGAISFLLTCSLDALIYGTTALLGVIFYQECSEDKKKHKIFPIITLFLFSIFLACAFLYKVSWEIPGVFSILLLIIYAAYKKKKVLLTYSVSGFILFSFFSFIFYKIITSGTFRNFLVFLKHSYSQISLYSQMMAEPSYLSRLYGHPVSYFTMIFFVYLAFIFLGILFIIYRFARVPIVLILFPVLFTSFKSGFVLADSSHMLIFVDSVSLILLSVVLLIPDRKIQPHNFILPYTGNKQNINKLNFGSLFSQIRFTRNIFLPGIFFISVLFLFGLNMSITHSSGFDYKNGAQTLKIYFVKGLYRYISEKMNKSHYNMEVISNQINGNIKKIVKGHNLVSIPFDLTLPDALGARPLFYPSLQFYTGYTEGLDRANLEYFKKLNHKDYILLQPSSLFLRYPFDDCPRTYEWLLTNYNIVKNYGNSFLLIRKNKNVKIIPEKPVFVGDSLNINIPSEINETEFSNKTYFERLIVKNLTGGAYRLRTLLLRSPWLMLQLHLSDGKKFEFHTFPAFLSRGVWISPFFRNAKDLKTWINGNRKTLPYVVSIQIKIERNCSKYFNKKPEVYIQKCYLITKK
jgi:hypothetical protein